MSNIYDDLFALYGDPILHESGCRRQVEIEKFLSTLNLPDEKKTAASDYLTNSYFRWSTDAFAVGLHLGLSLLNNNISRLRPQEGQ